MRWIAAFFLGLLMLGVLGIGSLLTVRVSYQQEAAHQQFLSEAAQVRKEMQRVGNQVREVASSELGHVNFPHPMNAQAVNTPFGPPVTVSRISVLGLILMVLFGIGLLMLAVIVASRRRSGAANAGMGMNRQDEMLTVQRILDKLDSMERRAGALEAELSDRLGGRPL